MTADKTTLRTINVALLGFGTVGGGVYQLVERQQESFPYRIGCRINIKKILVRDRNKAREGVDPSLLTDDFQEILSDGSIDMIVELMGGIHPAKEYILQALAAGKQVVTANKDLIAAHGKEIFGAAKQGSADLRFEAAVAGGIPVIGPLMKNLAGDDIEEVLGIVNGTTNYILTKMEAEGMEFDAALAEATRLGYAEADPTADIEGYDAARKCAILSTLAFHSWVTTDDVVTEGITKLTASDIRYARELGYEIKLLAVAREEEGAICSAVYPVLIPEAHQLASVDYTFNAVFVRGKAVGDAMFYGRGAGELPTANAVLGDMMEIAVNLQKDACGMTGDICYRNLPFKADSERESGFYLRLPMSDRLEAVSVITEEFAKASVEIHQQWEKEVGEDMELVIMTEKAKEQEIYQLLERLKEKTVVCGHASVVRVY